MTDPALASQKAALRIDARNRRKGLLIEHPEADWMAADHAEAMLVALKLTRPGVMAIYKALGAEIDPRPMGDIMIKTGWRLALPSVEDPDGPMVFRTWAPGERLAHDLTGLPAPLVAAPEVRPDIIITPLLAFDRAGRRLGQGGGHYDRTFDALREAGKRPPFIGMAFSGQEYDAVPHEPHDQRLDGFLTEAGYIAARKDD
ncbi:MAG: 5-formyltetrahydrofolate cyclo-ligase [Caulobacter sp.]|nr:5-formyltetrahydrofolate cyclo-ligase [Caulobacter sp.]